MSNAKPAEKKTGAEDVHWDLSDLYEDIDDPAIDRDLKWVCERAAQFSEVFRGALTEKLGEALAKQAELNSLVEKIYIYLFLRKSTDATNANIERRIAQVSETWSRAEADHLNFFEHELVAISDEVYADILQKDENARRHQSLLDHLRANRQYLLSEPVERALVLRGPFGSSEWSDYVDESEAELRFSYRGESKTLPEILHVIGQDSDRVCRAEALASLSTGLSEQRFDKLMARALNAVMGEKAVEDRERGYKEPMSARNIGNKIDDDTVAALHTAVAGNGAAQARRYYRLLAAHLKVDKLKWSDRNAPLPFADNQTVPWGECVDTVLAAYGSFSTTLRDLVARMIDRKWVDAPPYSGKTGGAFNYSVLLPSGEARAYNFLNYLGSSRDVMTTAHELGHGVHGILAAEAQGPLMFRAPMAYAETASIFGEMTTFRYLLDRASTDEQRLALLMSKASDHVNTVVRQISFSNFEQRIHKARRDGKLTLDDFNKTWMAVTTDFYGQPGDQFTYEHVDNLWAYVSHFLRPFYVYAYAFGELFTQSLYSVRDQFGSDFETMYLDVLRAGGKKTAAELMEPFGLDPREPDFWDKGIAGSITAWLDEAEALSAKLGVSG